MSLTTSMTDRRERKQLIAAWTVVLGVALVHRVALFLLHRDHLDAFIEANSVWYIFQYLPREMLRDHLVPALLLLQQTPPVQNLLMGLALKGFAWPAGVAKVLIGLQTLGSILTAAVLVHLLSVLYPRRVLLWTAVGLLFVLNTDLLVLEYNNMGQIMYEQVAMLMVLVILDALVGLRRTGGLRWAVVAGVAMGVLVLARATWSFFPALGLLLVAWLAPARRARAVLGCLLPLLVLQGGWTVKNYAVYGVLSPATSAWGGMHARAGLRAAGLEKDFEDSRRDSRAAAAGGQPETSRDPREIAERDAEVERKLGLSNPPLNTLGARIAFAQDQRDFFHFVRTHPETMLRKWWTAYQIFWQPIANYGRWWVSLFVVSNRITDPFDFRGIVHQLRTGSLPDVAYVASGTHPVLWLANGSPPTLGPYQKNPSRHRVAPTNLYALRWIEPMRLMLEIVATHVLLPLLGVAWVIARMRRVRAARPLFDPLRVTALLVGATLYGYLAIAANLIETAENMRYRLEVEPVLWVTTLICVTELASLLRAATRGALRRRPPDRSLETTAVFAEGAG